MNQSGGVGTAKHLRQLNIANAKLGDYRGLVASERYHAEKKTRSDGRKDLIQNNGLSRAVPKIHRLKSEGMSGDESRPWCPDLGCEGIFGQAGLIRLGVHYTYIEGLVQERDPRRFQQLCRMTGTTMDFWQHAASRAASIDWDRAITYRDYIAWCYLVGTDPEVLEKNPFRAPLPPGHIAPIGLFDEVACDRGMDLSLVYAAVPTADGAPAVQTATRDPWSTMQGSQSSTQQWGQTWGSGGSSAWGAAPQSGSSWDRGGSSPQAGSSWSRGGSLTGGGGRGWSAWAGSADADAVGDWRQQSWSNTGQPLKFSRNASRSNSVASEPERNARQPKAKSAASLAAYHRAMKKNRLGG